MDKRFDRAEVGRAFKVYWQTGSVREDWSAWADLFTEDVLYLERVLGTMHGREAVRAWIVPLMERYREIYGVLDWYHIDESGRVGFSMINRRDDPAAGAAIDFPGFSILQYAGDGRWSMEEDYWPIDLATACLQRYEARLATHDPDHRAAGTRRDWGDGPDWTRGASSHAGRNRV